MDYVKYIRDKVGTAPINLTGVNVLIVNDKDEVLLIKSKKLRRLLDLTVFIL